MIVLFLTSISFIILFVPIFWWLDSTHIWWICSDNINRNGIASGSLEMRRHLQQLSSLNWNLVLLLLHGFSCNSEPLKETLRDSSPGGFIRSYTYQTLSAPPVLPLSCLSSSLSITLCTEWRTTVSRVIRQGRLQQKEQVSGSGKRKAKREKGNNKLSFSLQMTTLLQWWKLKMLSEWREKYQLKRAKQNNNKTGRICHNIQTLNFN